MKRSEIKRKTPMKRTRFKASESSNLPRSAFSSRKKATKRSKRAKTPTTGQLKKRTWKEFSIFIRTRGVFAGGFNQCVTCGVSAHWKTLHAGHFLRGRLNANLFDERGVNPQCYSCNVGKQGEVVMYYKWMLAHHGQDVIDELIEQNSHTHKWEGGELQALLLHYKSQNAQTLATMENGNG